MSQLAHMPFYEACEKLQYAKAVKHPQYYKLRIILQQFRIVGIRPWDKPPRYEPPGMRFKDGKFAPVVNGQRIGDK